MMAPLIATLKDAGHLPCRHYAAIIYDTSVARQPRHTMPHGQFAHVYDEPLIEPDVYVMSLLLAAAE